MDECEYCTRPTERRCEICDNIINIGDEVGVLQEGEFKGMVVCGWCYSIYAYKDCLN